MDSDDVSARVTAFREDRDRRQQLALQAVSTFGVRCIILCFGVLAPWLTIDRVLGIHPSATMVVRPMMTLSGVFGVVTLSTCPVDIVKLDDMFAARPRLRIALGFVALGYNQIQRSWLPATIIRSLGAVALIFAFRRNRFWTPAESVCSWLTLAHAGALADNVYLCLTSDKATPLAIFGCTCNIMFIFVALLYCVWKYYLHKSSQGLEGWPSTLCCYWAMYTFCAAGTLESMGLAILSPDFGLALSPLTMDVLFEALTKAFQAVAYGAPLMVLLVMGRKRLFHFGATRFEKASEVRQQDGAFIASLLDGKLVKPGDSYWVQLEATDRSFGADQWQRNWRHCRVLAVLQDHFVVESHDERCDGIKRRASVTQRISYGPRNSVSDPTGRCSFPADVCLGSAQWTMAHRGDHMSCDEIVSHAKRNMRCVEFDSLPREVFLSNSDGTEVDWKSVGEGEVIDWFLSHSWHDDGERKFDCLCSFAAQFRNSVGRGMTLWLDKLCIDQDNIADGLRVLPVNVMACRKVLVIWGSTYPSRLWCVWELFTVLAFRGSLSVAQRIEILPVDEDTEFAEALAEFDMNDARCYDPNEERHLRQVITAIGSEHFNESIRNLASALHCGDFGSSTSLSTFKMGVVRTMSIGSKKLPRSGSTHMSSMDLHKMGSRSLQRMRTPLSLLVGLTRKSTASRLSTSTTIVAEEPPESVLEQPDEDGADISSADMFRTSEVCLDDGTGLSQQVIFVVV